jgi:23S rRNA (adenine-N6)-dimethyltransferase
MPLVRADVIVEWAVARKRALPWPSTFRGVLWGVRYELGLVRRLPAACFEPRPTVDAGLLRIRRRPAPLVAEAAWPPFRSLVAAAFTERRPPVRVLAGRFPPQAVKRALRAVGGEGVRHASDLDLHQWVEIFAELRAARRAPHASVRRGR